jgi:hypothetical protein
MWPADDAGYHARLDELERRLAEDESREWGYMVREVVANFFRGMGMIGGMALAAWVIWLVFGGGS